MKLHRFSLRPLAPWAGPLRSDTLYGLLLWHIAERQGDDACRSVIAAFERGEPPFVLSSVLPEDRIFAPQLPPMPRERFRQWAEDGRFATRNGTPLGLGEALQAFKRFRKLATLPLSVWRQQAENLSAPRLFAAFCALDQAEGQTDGQAVTAGESVEPHVSIDRRSGGALEGGLYFNRLHWFAEGTCLHLYARTDAPDTLLAMLREVGELGFGKDAALGRGRFAVERDTAFRAETLENAGPDSLLLSVCAAGDMSALDGWYATETKRGKAWGAGRSPFKNPLLLVREGGLLRHLPEGPFVLRHIHPNAGIVQITQPLCLPCRLSEEV